MSKPTEAAMRAARAIDERLRKLWSYTMIEGIARDIDRATKLPELRRIFKMQDDAAAALYGTESFNQATDLALWKAKELLGISCGPESLTDSNNICRRDWKEEK